MWWVQTSRINNSLVYSHLFLKFSKRLWINWRKSRKDPITQALRFYKKLSKSKCTFKKLAKISWGKKSDVVGKILMDLRKKYDCLPHDILIVKLAACWFDKAALYLIQYYLLNWCQRVKIGSSFSPFVNIYRGFPRGYKLAPNFTARI